MAQSSDIVLLENATAQDLPGAMLARQAPFRTFSMTISGHTEILQIAASIDRVA
jgi:hypothetical protein